MLRLARFAHGTLIALLVSSAGCGLTAGQKAAARTFGDTATTYGTTVEGAAPKASEAAYRLRANGLGYPTNQSREAFLKAVPELSKFLRSPTAREHAQLVVATAKAIGDYGKALADYVDAGESEDRADRFTSVAGTFNQLLGMPAAKSTANAIGLVVNFATAQVAEAIKKNTALAIVTAYGPAIKGAARLLEAEFKGEREGTLVFAYRQELGIFDDRTKLTPKTSPLVSSGLSAAQLDAATVADAEARQRFVALQLTLLEEQDRVDTLSKAGVQASRDLAAAQDELERVLFDKHLRWQAVASFAESVATLYAAFKAGE